MVLNPAWFNGLVDDTGTGTTGTVWNKATIAGLTSAIDSELGRLDYEQNVYTPTISAAGGGTATYSIRSGIYMRVAKHFCWVGFHLAFTKGSLTSSPLWLNVPFTILSGQTLGGPTIPQFSGLTLPISSLGTYSNPGDVLMTLVYVAGGGAGQIGFLDASHLGAGTIELVGSGVYCTT